MERFVLYAINLMIEVHVWQADSECNFLYYFRVSTAWIHGKHAKPLFHIYIRSQSVRNNPLLSFLMQLISWVNVNEMLFFVYSIHMLIPLVCTHLWLVTILNQLLHQYPIMDIPLQFPHRWVFYTHSCTLLVLICIVSFSLVGDIYYLTDGVISWFLLL